MILSTILSNKLREVEERCAARPLEVVEAGLVNAEPPRCLFDALSRPELAFIAEIKRRSPSGGRLMRPDASASDLANVYAANGAAALSLVTDSRYFGGQDGDLKVARDSTCLPILRKDFVLDAYQIFEARAMGADAVLLIVRALTAAQLRDLLQLTHRLGMQALVETRSAEEVRQALAAGARIVGVNNRNLDTLVTDVSLALRLRPLVPHECVFVAESGISQPEQVTALREASVDAVLIGEGLLRAADPGAKLASLVAASVPAPTTGAHR